MINNMIFLNSPFLPLNVMYFLILHSKNIRAVPSDYCFHQLNKSDCNTEPTPVFSYYRPGSRCEIEIWRGCPTYNKFDDEYQCSHTCIFRYRVDSGENKILNYVPHKNGKLIFEEEKSKKSWIDEIKSLPKEDVKLLGKLLNKLDSPTTASHTSEVIDVTETESVTAAITEETTVTQTIVTEDLNTTLQVTTEITTSELTTETTEISKIAEPSTTTVLTTIPITETTTVILTTIPTTQVTTSEPTTEIPKTTEATTITETTTVTTEKEITTAKDEDLERSTTKPTTELNTEEVTTIEILTTTTTEPTTQVATTTITTTTGDPEEVIIM